MSGRGILYFNQGQKCLIRQLVSLHSLRKHWQGSAALVNAGPAHDLLVEGCQRCGVDLLEYEHYPSPVLAAKVWALQKTPFVETFFLDADTVIVGELASYFDFLEGRDFVFTQFSDWLASEGLVHKRIESWRGIGVVADELLDRAQEGPAINLGSFAYRKHSFLEKWLAVTMAGARHGRFIPDEIAAQIHLPLLNCVVAPAIWGVSVRYGFEEPENRVIHYHGNKHNRDFPLCALWRRGYESIREVYGLPELPTREATAGLSSELVYSSAKSCRKN